MTGIVFEAYTGADGAGSALTPRWMASASDTSLRPYAVGRVRFTGAANAGVNASGRVPRVLGVARANAGVAGTGRLPTFSSFGADSLLATNVAVQTASLPVFLGAGSSYSVGVGNQSAATPRFGAFATAVAGAVALGRVPQVRGSAIAVAQPQSFVLALQSAGYVAITGSGAVGGYQALTDRLVSRDSYELGAIVALADLMRVSAAYSTLTQALQALTDGMSLHDLASLIYSAGLLDTFIATGVLSGYAQITVLLSDDVVLSEAADAKSQILAAIADGFYVHVTLTTGEDTYTAWVMTPETKALRSYSNWPFNSYAQLNGAAFAAGPQGIYRLGGKTDAGAIIAARVRSGLLDFGSGRLKRIDRAYIGYTSTGTLCLRMCALSETGTKVEYTYKMVAQPAQAPVEGRVPVGRGPRSVYWSFEICNDAAGSDFELHDISVLPMVLTGRMM